MRLKGGAVGIKKGSVTHSLSVYSLGLGAAWIPQPPLVSRVQEMGTHLLHLYVTQSARSAACRTATRMSDVF